MFDRYEFPESKTAPARPRFRLKRVFPRFEELREAFSAQLDEVLDDNAQMLLRALNPPDTVPYITEAEIPDMSVEKQRALADWELSLDDIYRAYQNHPQRFRPRRLATEERLLRAFAGLVNERRQFQLGIDRYVWVTRRDEAVRAGHQPRHGVTFSWTDEPTGGHPGTEPNCRCVARPVRPNLLNNVVLAQVTTTTDVLPLADAADLARALRALTAAGASLLVAEGASRFVDRMREGRFLRASRIVGADITTVEGHLAATAYGRVEERVLGPGFDPLPKTTDAARIAGEAAALYEMMNPGTILGTSSGDRTAELALGRFVTEAYAAFEAGRLTLLEDRLAEGWIEVLPGLTEDERRLGELPGFTPERLEEFLEVYPVETLGLPVSTGAPAPGDPSTGIVSTPAPDTELAIVLESRRFEPGIATGQGQSIGPDWMRQGVASGGAPIPAQIADKLRGREFANFDALREAFWKEVAADPDLAAQFAPQSLARMVNGRAPTAPIPERVGQRLGFELDHIERLSRGGEVYDVDNLQVMTPRAHIEKTRNE